MNELCHYGTPKMRWGVRRWQYEDGSLTPEGRIHYGVGDKRVGKDNRPAITRALSNTPEALRRANEKRVSNMSEEEITEKIRRLEMEKDLLSKEIEYQKKIGERSVPKYLTYLKDIKDITSIVSGIANDVSSVGKAYNSFFNKNNNNNNNNNP